MKTHFLAITLAAALGAGCKAKPEDKPLDNTAQNARGSATADQAGQSRSDVNIAQSVRKTVTGDGILSTSAHNCKIIVNRGVVTLAGPVANDDERARIEGIATATPGVSKVVNQLEVSN